MSEEQAKYGLKYLIDTDVIINHLKVGSNKLNTIINRTDMVYISVITEYELYRGIHNDEERNMLRTKLKFFRKIDINSDICIKASEYIKNDHIKQSLGLADLLIGATCNINDLVLVTNNIKHFKMIKDINLYEEEK